MNRRSLLVIAVVADRRCVPCGPAAADGSEPWTWPLPGHDVSQRFDKPASAYGPGHRGVDLAASAGDTVRAVAAGRVAFVGSVAGTPVVTIEHGDERSTYQPVSSRLQGRRLGRGRSSRSARCSARRVTAPGRACTSAESSATRLPRSARAARQRSIPARSTPTASHLHLRQAATARSIDRSAVRSRPPSGCASTRSPACASCTTAPTSVSPAAPPVHAAAAGTVVGRSTSSAYGKRIVIRHRPGLETSYNHLSRQSVSVGERVGRR